MAENDDLPKFTWTQGQRDAWFARHPVSPRSQSSSDPVSQFPIPFTGTPSPVTPSGPTPTSPITGAPIAYPDFLHPPSPPSPRDNWMARGGSDATLHRAETRAGYRPFIDARAPHAANDPLAAASADAEAIRESWGWGPSPGMGNVGGSGSQLWRDMTQHFNEQNQQRDAVIQTNRQAVLDRLGSTDPVTQMRQNPRQSDFQTPYGPVARSGPGIDPATSPSAVTNIVPMPHSPVPQIVAERPPEVAAAGGGGDQ